jgi:hypothetical protein
MIFFLAGPSFHEGSGSATKAAATPHKIKAMARINDNIFINFLPA